MGEYSDFVDLPYDRKTDITYDQASEYVQALAGGPLEVLNYEQFMGGVRVGWFSAAQKPGLNALSAITNPDGPLMWNEYEMPTLDKHDFFVGVAFGALMQRRRQERHE